MANFEDYLDNLGREAEGDFNSRAAGLKREEDARQDFLQEFRDTAARIIVPVFERAAKRSSPALSFQVNQGTGKDSVELQVAMKINPHQTMSGSIRYEAELKSRLIIRHDIFPSGRQVEGKFHSDDLSSDEVESRIKFFLANFRLP